MVAGLFYPDDPDRLFESIHRCFTHSVGPGRFPLPDDDVEETHRIECIVAPHAGYDYSGPVAAHSYQLAHDFFAANADGKNMVFILGPNHHGIGSAVSLSPHKYWSTPLGLVEVDAILTQRLVKKSSVLDIDEFAHSREHSIEVQLPFLQSILPPDCKIRFVPISVMMQDIETSKELAEDIFNVVQDSEQSFLIVASSDLTHYESQQQASIKDQNLLEPVKNLDLLSFYNVVERFGITACGYGPIAAVMQLSKLLGRKRGRVLKYATSGDVTGENSSVVGYSAVHFV